MGFPLPKLNVDSRREDGTGPAISVPSFLVFFVLNDNEWGRLGVFLFFFWDVGPSCIMGYVFSSYYLVQTPILVETGRAPNFFWPVVMGYNPIKFI